MTLDEFRRIEINTVICDRADPARMFVIYDLDAFGNGPDGPFVMSGEEINVEKPRYMRLDKGNCRHWDVVGRLKED